jgi:hypothetical protein
MAEQMRARSNPSSNAIPDIDLFRGFMLVECQGQALSVLESKPVPVQNAD